MNFVDNILIWGSQFNLSFNYLVKKTDIKDMYK